MVWDETRAKRFGAALRARRVEKGLSQEALAFRAGVTKNQVQLIEAGRSSGRVEAAGPSNPRLSTLTGLADVLGLQPSELLELADL